MTNKMMVVGGGRVENKCLYMYFHYSYITSRIRKRAVNLLVLRTKWYLGQDISILKAVVRAYLYTISVCVKFVIFPFYLIVGHHPVYEVA